MKRFLFVLFEGGGNVPPQLAIVRRLAARGHAVRVLGDRALEPEARAAGCELAPFRSAPYHDLRRRPDEPVKRRAGSPAAGVGVRPGVARGPGPGAHRPRLRLRGPGGAARQRRLRRPAARRSRLAAPWTSPWPDRAAEPLVVVALGSTFQDQAGLTQRVIDALGGLPVRGLVTLGDVFAPTEFRLPANVVAVGSAPHRAVFPQARAVVTHAGRL